MQDLLGRIVVIGVPTSSPAEPYAMDCAVTFCPVDYAVRPGLVALFVKPLDKVPSKPEVLEVAFHLYWGEEHNEWAQISQTSPPKTRTYPS